MTNDDGDLIGGRTERGPSPVSRGASPDPGEVRYVVGRRVRRLRRERGWSVEYLASRCGLHPTGLSRVERGEREPRLRTVAKVAAGLGVTLASLVAAEGVDDVAS